MGSIKALVKSLEALPAKMQKASQIALNKEVPKLILDFKSRSPIDSGAYRSSWVAFYPSVGSNVFASVGIRNDDPKAAMLDQGATPHSFPWYFPSNKEKTGKLTESGGKIWAGGLNPGHSMTIGGAIDPVLFKNTARQLQITKAIANSVIKVI